MTPYGGGGSRIVWEKTAEAKVFADMSSDAHRSCSLVFELAAKVSLNTPPGHCFSKAEERLLKSVVVDTVKRKVSRMISVGY